MATISPFRINEETGKVDRSRMLVVSRHLIRYYLSERYHLGWSYIGRLTNCNHATVIWSCKYVEDLSTYDSAFAMYKASIKTNIYNPALSMTEKIRMILVNKHTNESKIYALVEFIQEELEERGACLSEDNKQEINYEQS